MTDRAPRRLSPLTPLVRGFLVLLAAATTVVRDLTRGDLGPTAVLFVTLLVGGAVYGTTSWLLTTFWIEADELRVDTGVLYRQSRRIRIDRLQGVDIVQPFVARLLGLAELRMDVAGGGAREGSLAYLPLGEARRLRDLLLDRRDQLAASGAPVAADNVDTATAGTGVGGAGEAVAVGTATAGAARTEAGPASGRPAVPERVLAQVDLTTLLTSLLLSGEMVTLVSLSAVLGVVSLAGGEYLGVSAALPVVLALGVPLYRRFTGSYRFTVSDTTAGLQVRRGLFELTAQTIALPRVQGVVISEPLLWRRLGWAQLDVSVAGYGVGLDDERTPPSTVLPVGDRALALELARHVLRGLDPASVELRPVPRRARWLSPVGHRFLRAGTTERLVVSRAGWFVRRTHVAPQARVQSVRVTQGPLQRRLGLADVHLDSPPGPVEVRARHRDAAEARRLFGVEVAMTRWARRRP